MNVRQHPGGEAFGSRVRSRIGSPAVTQKMGVDTSL
jgi:hypothetical protein